MKCELLGEGGKQEDLRLRHMLPSYYVLDDGLTAEQRAVGCTVILVECRVGAGHGGPRGGLRQWMCRGTAHRALTPTGSWRGGEPSQRQARSGAVPEVGVGQVTLSAAVGSLGCERHRRALLRSTLLEAPEAAVQGLGENCEWRTRDGEVFWGPP